MELYLCKDANDFVFFLESRRRQLQGQSKKEHSFCKEEAVEKGSREERERRRK